MHTGTSLGDAIRNWPTPRAEDAESAGNHPGAKDSLTGVTRDLWQSPLTSDANGAREPDGKRSLGLNTDAENWPTPAARDHKGSPTQLVRADGKHRLDQLDRVAENWDSPLFRLDPQTVDSGDGSLSDDRISRLLSETWSTPRTNCNIQNKKNLATPAEGGRSSKPGLEDQIQKFDRDKWSTPRAGGNRTSPKALTSREDGGGGTAALSLEQQATGEILMSKTKAKLNPMFVEWLMGLPLGWTDFAPVGTEWYRWKRRMRSLLFEIVSSGRSSNGRT